MSMHSTPQHSIHSFGTRIVTPRNKSASETAFKITSRILSIPWRMPAGHEPRHGYDDVTVVHLDNHVIIATTPVSQLAKLAGASSRKSDPKQRQLGHW